MENAHNNDFSGTLKVVDRILRLKDHAQVWTQLRTLRPGMRKLEHLREALLDVAHEFCRERFGSLLSKIAPDLGKIYFRRFGEPEMDRSANSFLPLATIRRASNLATRPLATSASPRSMSTFISAN